MFPIIIVGLYTCRRNRSQRTTGTPTLMEALSTIAKKWKELINSSTDKQINKMRHKHTWNIIPFLKKEILSYATTQVNLKDIMPNETRQSPKYKSYMVPDVRNAKTVKFLANQIVDSGYQESGWECGLI